MNMFCVYLNRWISRDEYETLCEVYNLSPTGAVYSNGWPEMMDEEGLIFELEY